MNRRTLYILLLLLLLSRSALCAPTAFTLDDIIEDIYRQLTELSTVSYEELQTRLYELAQSPIDINHATERDLQLIPFLSAQQIDNLLLYVYQHPMHSLSELLLVPGFTDYELRNLQPFVTLSTDENGPFRSSSSTSLPAHEVFRQGKHELLTRVDASHLESFKGDPVQAYIKYKFHYANRVSFGATLKRPTAAPASELQYTVYAQLNRLGVCRELVLGSFQAHFGQGLVLSSPFHLGKNNYVLSAGQQPQGLRKYTSPDGNGLQGAGATFEWGHTQQVLLSASVLYSINRHNDSTLRHTIGANLSLQHKQLQLGLTFAQKLYSDSVHYYHNPQYTQHYFHGDKQTVIGLNGRYHFRILDLFFEAAAAQNTTWGWGLIAGARIAATPKIGLLLLYRYYSPYFDNPLAYAFSESSRLHDENGLYAGLEIKQLTHWRFTAYGDIYRFSNIKYGIPYSPSWGYDSRLEAQYTPSQRLLTTLQLRAREKAKEAHYSFKGENTVRLRSWKFHTRLDANLAKEPSTTLTYGWGLAQDIQYTFARVPICLQARLQYWHARDWANRIYYYENDVLYGFSIPALYGEGLRAYLNLKYRIINQLTLYLRISESYYFYKPQPSYSPTQTDIHLLLRAYI